MTEFLLPIDLEGIHVINFVLDNRKSCGIRDDLGKAM